MWISPFTCCDYRVVVADEDEWTIEWLWMDHAMRAHPGDYRVRALLNLPFVLEKTVRDMEMVSVYRPTERETWGITPHTFHWVPPGATVEPVFAAATGGVGGDAP